MNQESRTVLHAFKQFMSFSGPVTLLCVCIFFVLARMLVFKEYDFGAIELIFCALAFLLWGVFEWCMHKYILHGQRLPIINKAIPNPFTKMHAEHHKNDENLDTLFYRPYGVMILCLAAYFGFSLMLMSFVASLIPTAIVTFRIYIHEWVHLLAHRPCREIPLVFRLAVSNHQKHHVTYNANYGVSSIVGDLLFSTYD